MSVNTEIKPKIEFKFDPSFLKTVDLLLTSYQDGMRILNNINKNPVKFINDNFGICDNGYKLRYVTPKDVTTFVSYVCKLVTEPGPFSIQNVTDAERMAVAMIQRFVRDNEKCVPFEDTNAYGTDAYINQRTITLPKLLVMARNEFYDTNVYSQYDMCERAKAITDDLQIMNSLNFPVNIRKLIANIPKIVMDNCEVLRYQKPKAKLVVDLIQRFIQTVCALNLCSIEQMSKYCIPRTSFEITKIEDRERRLDYDYYKEDGEVILSDGYVTESVNMNEYKPVFINLSTGGDNFVSNTIKKVTGEDYSHSSISFDPNLETMYTFNGGFGADDKYKIQAPGFQREALRSSKFKNVRCTTYCVFVPNATYERMRKAVEDMEKSNAKYDYKAIFDRWRAINKYGADANPRRGDTTRRQVCSTFVNSIMSVAGDPVVEKEIVSPGELGKSAMTRPNEFFKYYDGPGDQFNPEEAMDKLKNFMNDAATKAYHSPYTEYVTECCLLKTNGMRIHSKIPFNCNMRDVVLQDMHPEFKDTRSAIMFMVSDERSPITGLLRKYRTLNEMEPAVNVLNMFMRLKDPSFVIRSKANDIRNHQLGMHTDVNWLDKIAYGNLFLDGNYRADALGNNKFTPIENALSHLYSMYAPEDMKDNVSLANNIVTVANTMLSIIDQYNDPCLGGCVYNWEMFRDILATFGEILTRSMLRLYHNNATVVYVSDDMADSLSAGYTYTESFEMFLEADDDNVKTNAAKAPSISVKATTNKEGAAKVWGNIKNVALKFFAWCQRLFQQLLSLFRNNHDSEINWVKNHDKLNQEIGKALGSGFEVNVTNFRPYKIQGNLPKDLKIGETMKDLIEAAKNGDKIGDEQIPTDPLALFKYIIKKSGITGLNPILNDTAVNNTKTAQDMLRNYFLYGEAIQNEAIANTRLTTDMWTDIVNDLKNSDRLVKAISDGFGKPITDTNNAVKAALNSIKTNQSDAQTDNQNQGGANNGEQNKNSVLEQLCNAYINSVSTFFTEAIINSVGKYFYAMTYKVYRNVIAAYKSQYDSSKANSDNKTGKEQPEETPDKQVEQGSGNPNGTGGQPTGVNQS